MSSEMIKDAEYIGCFVDCMYCDVKQGCNVLCVRSSEHGYVACDLCTEKAEADREKYMHKNGLVFVSGLLDACSFLKDARFEIPRTNGSTTPGGVIRPSAYGHIASKTATGWMVPVEFNEDGSDAGTSGNIFKVVKLESLNLSPAQLVEILAFLNSQVA
jgi:hypothetical protein